MNKKLTILVTAIAAGAVCLSACKGKTKEPAVSEASSVITTVSETTQSSETETAPQTVPDGESSGPSDAANTVTAEYNAEVGKSYPMRYENDAVYCYDPSTGEKKTGNIRINGIVYFFDPAAGGQLTDINVNDFFSKAVFIGNSTSEGLTTYFNSKGKDYLGGPLVAAKVSYSYLLALSL